MSGETILNWAAHTGISVGLLIVLILLVRRPFARKFGAQAAYWLWALPFIRMVLPALPVTINLPSWLVSTPKPLNETMVPLQFETAIYSPTAVQSNWQTPVLLAWLAVATIWLAVQIIRQRKFLESIGEASIAAPEFIQTQTSEICRTLNISVPDVRVATTNIGPLVTGVFRPIVILPQNFGQNFSERQRHFALIHELAHIKRRDLWMAFGALVFRALNWPNPLVHMAAAKFRIDQEAACDAYILKIIGGGVRAKQNYAATLIHCAKLTQPASPTGQALQTNPLCLTIYHPLKERLMTLKTSKTNSTILSRIGAGTLLAGALAVTAPVTIAAGPVPPQPPATEAEKMKTKTRQVMQWVEKIDGVETTKHIEINTQDGVITAYNIDEHGNKTKIDPADVKIMSGSGLQIMADEMQTMGNTSNIKAMRVIVMDADEAGETGKKHVKIITTDDLAGLQTPQTFFLQDGEHSKIIVKRMMADEDGNTMEVDKEIVIIGSGSGSPQASRMVGAAQRLLDQAQAVKRDKELSTKTRRKLEKARKALKEAQAALEAEE